MKDPVLTRRQFGQGLTGIVISFALAPELVWPAAGGLPGNLGRAPMLDAWLQIAADGRVTIFTGKVELGQGVLTALAQIAAEELEVPLNGIRMVSGDTTLTPDEGYTSGSQSIEFGGTALRFACAEARTLLIETAAAQLSIPPEQLRTVRGVITAADGRKLTYGQIAQGGLFHRAATAQAPPKPAVRHEIVGTSVPRLDIPSKATGGASFVQDLRLPGMVFGRIVRPPGPRDRLETVETAAVQAMPGVLTVVRDGSFLGVVALREEQAIKAREALLREAKWRKAADLPEAGEIHAWLRTRSDAGAVVNEKKTNGLRRSCGG